MTSLWGRNGDVVLLGGASILALFIVTAFPEPFREIGSRPDRMLVLNALISYPHIIGSFYLFYGTGGNARAFPAIAWGVPIALVAVLSYCVTTPASEPLLMLAQLGFLYFFWHFLMQGVGCSLWLLGPGVDGKTRVSLRRVSIFVATLIALTGWLSLHQAGAVENVFALPLRPLPVPESFRTPLIAISNGALIFYAIYLIRLRPRIGGRAAFGAFLPILSLGLWFSPFLVGSPYRVLVQLLHGLQFLAFFRRTQVVSVPVRTFRLPFIWIASAGVGVALFAWIPERIEVALGVGQPGATGRIVAAFAIFLNVQHYAVDGTLWRLSDARNRRRLGLA